LHRCYNNCLYSNSIFVAVASNVEVLGDFSTQESSQLILDGTMLNVTGSLMLGGNFTISGNSSITVESCANINGNLILTNSAIQQYLSSSAKTNSTTILVSKAGCLTGNFMNVDYNQSVSSCLNVTVNLMPTQSSIKVILSSSNLCGSTTISSNIIGGIVGGVFAFVVIVCAVIFIVKKSREDEQMDLLKMGASLSKRTN